MTTDAQGNTKVEIEWETPKNFKYPQNQLFDYLAAAIKSQSAKTISNPTLLVQEGEKARVQAVESVITNIAVTDNANIQLLQLLPVKMLGLHLQRIKLSNALLLKLQPEISVAVPAPKSAL